MLIASRPLEEDAPSEVRWSFWTSIWNVRHKPVELHKDSQKVQACGLTLSQVSVVPGTARELHAQQMKFSKSSSIWHLATLYRIWDPHPERETRARKQCTSKCWAKWQAASKHDIKTKPSKNLICEGYLKDMSQGSCSIGSRSSGLPTDITKGPFKSCRSVATHSLSWPIMTWSYSQQNM